MKFEQAVSRVRASRTAWIAAYAFVPTVRRGVTAGGAVYVVAYDAEAPAGEDPMLVAYMAGIFGSGEGDVEVFTPDDAPEEALDLDYERTATYDPNLGQYDIEVVLAVLRGATIGQALEAFEAADRTEGPNATPEAMTADLLIAHGIPAVLHSPAGPLPAVMVLLDEDDPRLGVLMDAFGGVVVVEGDEEDAPEEASGRVPDESSNGSPGATPGGASDATPDDDSADESLGGGPDDEPEPAPDATWVGVGRGAVLAAALAARSLPEWEGDVPEDFADAWRALLAFAAASVAAPPDAEGRRPKAVYQELRRLTNRIERLMARQIADHAGLVRDAATVVAGEIAGGRIGPAELALPSPEELESPVPLPDTLWADPD